jgi:hypothetical protein
MEENRLRPMIEGYDPKLFNRLYENTTALKRKLAGQIDCRRFGVEYQDVLSWFDTKFLFVFNKHYGEPENILLAKIITSLQNFKCRVLRKAYTINHSQTILSVEQLVTFDDGLIEEHPEMTEKDFYYNKIMTFMRKHLSDNAYLLFEVQLTPPPFILSRINPGPECFLTKIPDEVLLEYFDLGYSEKAYKFLSSLKKEIRNAVAFAKSQFKDITVS